LSFSILINGNSELIHQPLGKMRSQILEVIKSVGPTMNNPGMVVFDQSHLIIDMYGILVSEHLSVDIGLIKI